VRADYSTTTEIADALMQRADVPFRTGHHFASKLTDYGRGKGLKLHEIPYSEVARLYKEEAKQAFPLNEKDFAEVISAEYMVFGRKGRGGPQRAEAERMLSGARDGVTAAFTWLKSSHARLSAAEASLDRAFTALAGK
jgi:argininosuccinate lyase